MTPKQLAELGDLKRRKLEESLYPLVGNPAFTSFLETIKQYEDVAIENALMNDSVTSDRATLAALGEVRAYRMILQIAENLRLALEDRAVPDDNQ